LPWNIRGYKGGYMAETPEIKELKKSGRGVVVPLHKQVPYDLDNIHLSREQFIAKQKERKEKALKIAEFAAGLDGEKEEKPAEVKEVKQDVKPRGRPKKIE
jgi:hypothetical protein